MKISRNTHAQLIVGENPILVSIAMALMALVFAGIGISVLALGEWVGIVFLLGAGIPLVCLYVFARRVQLIFNRKDGTLTIQRKNMREAVRIVHDLKDVLRADLESTQSDNGTLHRVTLVLKGESAGRHPITASYSNIGDHAGVATAINAWLEQDRPTPDPA